MRIVYIRQGYTHTDSLRNDSRTSSSLYTPFEYEYEEQVERNVQDCRNQNEQHWANRLAHASQNRNDAIEGYEQECSSYVNAKIGYRLRNNLFRRIGQAENRLGENNPCNG